MYNRYVPQGDGSFCKTKVPDLPSPGPSAPPPRHPQPPPPPPPPPCPDESKCIREEERHGPPPPGKGPGNSVAGFLRQLLPKNFDTGDLLIILLLLLMAGDSKEDQNTALLTLALYLFL